MNLDKKAEEAWQFLADEFRKETEKLPGEFTTKEFAESVGGNRDSVKRYLDNKVSAGELSSRKIKWEGKLTTVYKVRPE